MKNIQTKAFMIFAMLFVCGICVSTVNSQCTDTWINQAITELKGRPPIGSGGNGECNTLKYGGGSWSNYADLKTKVWSAFAGVIATSYENDPYKTRLCLDTQSFSAGSSLVASGCHGNKSQQFVIANNGTIRHGSDGMCLDGVNGNDRRLVTKPCTGVRTQQWFIDNIPDASVIPKTMNEARSRRSFKVMGQIQNQGNSLCIDIKNAATSSGEMLMWSCKDGVDRGWNQMFAVSPLISYGKAYVFSRWWTPVGMGHTAWAVRLLDTADGLQRWMIGGFDGDISAVVQRGGNNGWFMAIFEGANAETDVVNYFGGVKISGQYPSTMDFQKYTHYKIYSTGLANPAAAISVAYRSKDWGYGVFGNNCIDQTWKVLNSYGVPIAQPAIRVVMPWEDPAKVSNGMIPNTWFQRLTGPQYSY